MTKYKCGVCGKVIDSTIDKYIKYKVGRCTYIHEKCKAEALLMTNGQQNKPKPKKTAEEKEFDEYIKKLFNLDKMSVKIKKTAKKMIEENGFTFEGITLTLIYFYEIKGNSLEKANGNINIVPWIYEEAKQYFQSTKEVIEKNEEKNLDNWAVETRDVIIPVPQPKKEKDKIIDLERFIKDE